MQHTQLVFGEEAARDAGLVGEQEDKISGVVEAADRFRRIRHPADAVLRAHKTVVVIDDAVAVEEGGGLWRAAHFFGRLAHHGLLDLVADAVRDGEMDLLDHRRVVAGRDQQMIAQRAQILALGAGEADGDKPALARKAKRRQNIRRFAGGGQRHQHVAALAEPFDLPREHLLETVIVGDRGQRRGVGGQRKRRVTGPVLLVAADDFGGDVLGVGGAAAIADDQQLVAGTQCRDDRRRDFARDVEQRRIARRALQVLRAKRSR